MRLVLTAVVLLLVAPLGCGVQRDGRTQANASTLMTGSEDTGKREMMSPTPTPGEETVVPIVQEEVRVDTERVETGRVRLTKKAHERKLLVEQPSVQEEVQVERVPVNRVVAEPVSVRYEGDTIIIPVLEEVVVVETRWRVKEEVRVTKRQITTPGNQPVRLRTEEVHIERVPPRPNRPGQDEGSQ